MLSLLVGQATHAGRIRDLNEDSLLAERSVFLVADGMGGHAAGEVASHVAVEELGRLTGIAHLQPDDVVAAIDRANDSILAVAARGSALSGMGTTVAGITMVTVGGSTHWLVFNVGDSRVYQFTNGTLRQVTTDHSEVNELLSAGQITPDQALTYSRRNVVTRSLGSNPAPAPDIWLFPPTSNERFLICSDGLTNEVNDDAIADVLARESDPQLVADELVARALLAGGRDNITVVVVDSTPALLATSTSGDTAPRPQAGAQT